jgi:hypothetical protein
MPQQTTRFLFGKHQPDQEDLDTNYAVATNVLPRLRGYGPFNSFARHANTALPEEPLGTAFVARTSSGGYKFYLGTAHDLWLYNGTTKAFDKVSVSPGAYAASIDAPWSFDQFGHELFAVNINNAVQVIDVDAAANFAAVNSSLDPDSDNAPAPSARYVKVVGDFLVLGDLGGPDNNVVAWSGLNNSRWWKLGERSCDRQRFPDGGAVTAITGSDAGYVFQETAVRRMIFTPGGEPAYIFRFEKVENYHGAIAPRAVVPVGPHVFYLAQDGFYRIGPDGIVNIGFESVNDHFLTLAGQTNFKDTLGCSDPLHPRVYWAARTADAANPTQGLFLNRIMVFDYATQQWSEAEIDLLQLMPAAVSGITLEGLDAAGYLNIDLGPDDPGGLPASLDSKLWAGGAPLLGGVDLNRFLGFFTGPPMEAHINTAKLDIAPSRRSLIRKVRPLTDAPLPYVSVATLGFPSTDPAVVSNETTPEADGMCAQRSSGRYHRFRLRIPASQRWSYALGVEVDAVPQGGR